MDQSRLEEVLGTVFELLSADGLDDAAEIVRVGEARAEETGYDNWNGGTALWTIYFSLPPSDYARLANRRPQLEEHITARLKIVLEPEADAWYAASIVPVVVENPTWRHSSATLPRSVRQDIIDGLKLEGIKWFGRMDDVEFLGRIFDLTALPSTDTRSPYNKNAAADIWQHRVNNEDWEDAWIFSDSRFDLRGGAADTFLRFLCEMLHPLVRPDREETLRIAKAVNDQLRAAGWQLYEDQKIAGRSRYAYRRIDQAGQRTVTRAKSVADALNASHMAKEIERLEQAVERDPALAIGTAKELVESCCKSILKRRGVTFTNSAGLGDLTKLLTKELKLVPDGISDQARGADNIKQILRSLTAITHHLAELRGLYGTGHGRDGGHRGLDTRHARLAAGAAAVFIDFVTETYHHREKANGNN